MASKMTTVTVVMVAAVRDLLRKMLFRAVRGMCCHYKQIIGTALSTFNGVCLNAQLPMQDERVGSYDRLRRALSLRTK